MSRVQCLECGTAVVVDPTGVCPEGHVVGGTGVRVAGAMGSDTRHPDEPEPWVATVVLEEVDAAPVVRERTIRPLRLAGADATTDPEVGEATDHESMLRELQALGDVEDSHPGSATPPAPMSPAEAAPVPYNPPPPQEQVAEGFAELSALEAAFQALSVEEDATPRAGQEPDPPATAPSPGASAPTDAVSRNGFADLEDLFASHDAHTPEPTVARTHSASAPPAVHRPGSAETTSSPSLDPPDTPATGSPPPGSTAAAPDRDPVRDHVAAPPPSSTPSMPSEPRVAPDGPPFSVDTVEDPPPADADEAPPTSHVGVDITNFTAHGGKVGRGRVGRRKRFGR